MPRGDKYKTDPIMLDILLNAHRPLSISELGKLSDLGRDKARSFADRIILGKAGVPTPPGVKVVDIIMSRLNSTHHYRFIGLKGENYWNNWLKTAMKNGYRIARDHFELFPEYQIDPDILDVLRRYLPKLNAASKNANRSPSLFLDEMLSYVLHPNFEKGRKLLTIIASAAQSPDNTPERAVAISFLSQAGFLKSQTDASMEGT
ncbi:MAG: hypothetical protein ACTSR2_14455 [Candidatus Hodarchaeales archaeon]